MIQETRNLESRIEGLIVSWNVNCPYAISLKLVLDEWHDSRHHYDDKEETKTKLCFTIPMKNKSQVRFSYQTNSDGLPPTNIRGRCRPFLAPKTLSFQSLYRDVVYKNIQSIRSYSPIVETNTYEKTVASSIAEKTFLEKTSIADSTSVTGSTTFTSNQLEPEKITKHKACLGNADPNEKMALSTSTSNEEQKHHEDTLFPQIPTKGENNQVSKHTSPKVCNTVQANASTIVNTQVKNKTLTNGSSKLMESSEGIDDCHKKKRSKRVKKNSSAKSSEFARNVSECEAMRNDNVKKDIVKADKYNCERTRENKTMNDLNPNNYKTMRELNPYKDKTMKDLNPNIYSRSDLNRYKGTRSDFNANKDSILSKIKTIEQELTKVLERERDFKESDFELDEFDYFIKSEPYTNTIGTFEEDRVADEDIAKAKQSIF